MLGRPVTHGPPHSSFGMSPKQPLERKPDRLNAIRFVATEKEHRDGSGFVRTPGYIRDLSGDADKARVDALAGLLRSDVLVYRNDAGPRPFQQERKVCRLDVLRDR